MVALCAASASSSGGGCSCPLTRLNPGLACKNIHDGWADALRDLGLTPVSRGPGLPALPCCNLRQGLLLPWCGRVVEVAELETLLIARPSIVGLALQWLCCYCSAGPIPRSNQGKEPAAVQKLHNIKHTYALYTQLTQRLLNADMGQAAAGDDQSAAECEAL